MVTSGTRSKTLWVVHCIISCITPVDHAVTVLVNELNVTRTISEGFILLQTSLVSDALCITCNVAISVGYEVIPCKVAIGLKAPDLTILFTSVLSVDKVIRIPLGDSSLIVSKVEVSVIE